MLVILCKEHIGANLKHTKAAEQAFSCTELLYEGQAKTLSFWIGLLYGRERRMKEEFQFFLTFSPSGENIAQIGHSVLWVQIADGHRPLLPEPRPHRGRQLDLRQRQRHSSLWHSKKRNRKRKLNFLITRKKINWQLFFSFSCSSEEKVNGEKRL